MHRRSSVGAALAGVEPEPSCTAEAAMVRPGVDRQRRQGGRARASRLGWRRRQAGPPHRAHVPDLASRNNQAQAEPPPRSRLCGPGRAPRAARRRLVFMPIGGVPRQPGRVEMLGEVRRRCKAATSLQPGAARRPCSGLFGRSTRPPSSQAGDHPASAGQASVRATAGAAGPRRNPRTEDQAEQPESVRPAGRTAVNSPEEAMPSSQPDRRRYRPGAQGQQPRRGLAGLGG